MYSLYICCYFLTLLMIIFIFDKKEIRFKERNIVCNILVAIGWTILFTIKTNFWIFALSGIIVTCIIMGIIYGIYPTADHRFFKKNKGS